MKSRILGLTAAPKPRRNPDDGWLYHILPASGHEIKKIAKRMTRVEYLLDQKNRHVLNAKGNAVTRIDTDDDVVIEEALKKCPLITDVKAAVADENGGYAFDGDGKEIVEVRDVSDEETRRWILSNFMELTVDVDVPVDPELPDGEKKKVPRTVTMLVAEWVLDQSIEIARDKAEAEAGNS